MAFGITTQGYSPKTTADVKADLEAAFKAEFGATIDVSPQGPFGQIIGVLAERYADLWALGQAAYTAGTPDGAVDAAQDALCALTGTVRAPASKSTVTLTATGTPTTLLPAGRVASMALPQPRFATQADATITAVPAWVASTNYTTVGQRVTNAARVYQLITAGVAAGSGGPTTTAADITDGAAHWRYVGQGTGAIDVTAQSEQTGPFVALSGLVTTIETPVAGWSSVINLLDDVPGTNLETNAALRVRRENELRLQGNAAAEPIREKLLQQVADGGAGCTSATVFQNIDDVTDADGVPPHSIEALCLGGTDADIRRVLFAAVGAGIKTHGTTSGTVTDSEGQLRTIKFTRPTQLTVWAIFDLVIDVNAWPLDGTTQVKDNVIAYGAVQKGGKDVVSSVLGAQAFKVAGVLDCPPPKISLTNPATVSTTIAVNTRQLAVYDTSRITVNTTPGVP